MLVSMLDFEPIYKEIFADIDKNADNIIDRQEFHNMMSAQKEDRAYAKKEASQRGISVATYEQQEWDKVDTNHDGKIDFDEFYIASDREAKEQRE